MDLINFRPHYGYFLRLLLNFPPVCEATERQLYLLQGELLFLLEERGIRWSIARCSKAKAYAVCLRGSDWYGQTYQAHPLLGVLQVYVDGLLAEKRRKVG